MKVLSLRRAALLVPAVGIALVLPSAASAAPGDATVAAHAPGLVGSPILLENNASFSGYDVAVDGTGRTYVGWISSSNSNSAGRKVHLCTLAPGGTRCVGGIQTIDSLGASSAEGLRVLATSSGKVTLVWFHDTSPGSGNGPRGGRIATATSQSGGTLSAATDVEDAPSYGALLDAELGPNGTLWTLAYKGVPTTSVELREGTSATLQTLKTPYGVGYGEIAIHGSSAVVAIQKYGSITVPIGVSHASSSGGSWSAFKAVAHTWSAGWNPGLVSAKSGIRLYASVDNADYSPVVAKWTGTSFSRPTLIGDTNSCTPNSHDPVADASGRVVDVTDECGKITVTNLPDTTHASIVRFSDRGTEAGGSPQIASTPSGKAVVAWSIESSNGDRLYAARVLLPALRGTATKSVSHGRVTVTGPKSCLPAVSVAVSVTGRPASGWKVASKTLKLGSKKVGSSLNGASLTAGSAYSLVGTVVFSKAGSHVKASAALKFRTCPKP
ncbi:MAG TPA: hypothetical protein VMI11_01540 [Actinomycetes bacterium]|nr:hypothetical protein [Actinomycetes bacterium]